MPITMEFMHSWVFLQVSWFMSDSRWSSLDLLMSIVDCIMKCLLKSSELLSTSSLIEYLLEDLSTDLLLIFKSLISQFLSNWEPCFTCLSTSSPDSWSVSLSELLGSSLWLLSSSILASEFNKLISMFTEKSSVSQESLLVLLPVFSLNLLMVLPISEVPITKINS